MLERRIGRLTPSNLEKQNFERAQQTSAKQLNAPKRDDLGVGLYDDNTEAPKNVVIKYYHDLEKFPLTPSRHFDPNSQITVYSVGCPRIDGGGINALLYFAAPNKFFGFDTSDILNDWSELFNKDNEKRLNAHSRLPDWNITAEQIDTFREAIFLWFAKQAGLDLESTLSREGTMEEVSIWQARMASRTAGRPQYAVGDILRSRLFLRHNFSLAPIFGI